jgi:hypothetical protein
MMDCGGRRWEVVGCVNIEKHDSFLVCPLSGHLKL